MSVTPNSFIDYVATNSQTIFPIVRPRLSDSHLRVFQNGLLLALTTNYTIVGDDVVLVVGANTGDLLRIQRDTPQVTRVVDFMAGANLVESDLDQSALQNLYLAQELWDQTLQLRDQPTVLILWAPVDPLPDVSPNATWDEQAVTRLVPSLSTVLGVGQPWISVDASLKEVRLSPGKYRIDPLLVVEDHSVNKSIFSAGIGNDEDGAASVIQYVVANNQTVDIVVWATGGYLLDVTTRTSLTFKAGMVLTGGDIVTKIPSQWIVTRLGGDPALN